MINKNKTTGGKGTNQYKIKGVAKPKNEKLRVKKPEVKLPTSERELVDLAYTTKDPLELDALSKSKFPFVRQMVAANEKLPSEIENRFIDDPSEDVRQTLAMSPGASLDALRKLKDDKSKQVKIAAEESLELRQSNNFMDDHVMIIDVK
jgi:hypothetical protein